jgi:valyl-tRNA synthetase
MQNFYKIKKNPIFARQNIFEPMELSKTYNPHETENKWYAHWLKSGFFKAKPNPDKKPYTILIPPPNVTGVLHMGHMLNNTIQDVLIRRARMQGFEACWVPGTDHASIATEAKVVRMLREQGIKKSELTREEFLKHAFDWKEKYGGIILEQLKKLGASCDWDRTRFTMDDTYYKAVIRVFVDLYKKGYIYRGLRMINWDCEAKTALSNEEVLYNEEGEKANMYYVRYQIKDTDEWITVSTVRPETIMGDVAIAVNPTDERYQHLLGKFALVPFINRPIPVIADDYVEKDFGTGCLKVTPAHDPNDYEIGQRHHLEVIDTINLDGTLNELCQIPEFVGKDRFVVRKMMAKKLEEAGHLLKVEEIISKIGRSERTNTVVEPKLSLQWFIKMKEVSRKAAEVVEKDEIILHPAKFKNTYKHWMENVRDWCISRQLWWGHRIPAYYFGEGEFDFVVAESLEEAIALAKEKTGKNITAADLKQDEDVLDTWASSWLWPIAVFDGYEDEYFDKETGKIDKSKNADLNYFYPTNVLVTAPEILFFWVARMIIAGYEYLDEMPFKDVYLTGIVRDKLGRKMSKSLGNSPDPLDLIDKFGADGVRVGMLFSSPAGNDLPFDEKLCEQGRNFSNKIWNAFRLVKGWEVTEGDKNQTARAWFRAKMNAALKEIEDHFEKYKISDALIALYKLVWDDFCAWYLEMIKPEFGQPIDRATLEETMSFFETLLKVLHPFMPFITEELWHSLRERSEKDCIIVAQYPTAASFDEQVLAQADNILQTIVNIRALRSTKNISPKVPLELIIKTNDTQAFETFRDILMRLAGLEKLTFTTEKPSMPVAFIVKSDEFFVPLAGMVNEAEEKAKLMKDLEYYKGFLASVEKKLSNEKFVQNAKPEVLANERAKQADALAKIKAIEESL